MTTSHCMSAHEVRQMGDAYAMALFIGMPLYVLFLLSPIAASPDDGELRWVRTLVIAMGVTAVLVLLLQLDRFI